MNDQQLYWHITILKFILEMITMLTLEEQLQSEIEERGEKSPLAQMIRNQIAAEKSKQSFSNLYLTGSVKRPRN